MKDSKTLFCSSEFLSVRERTYSKFTDSLGTRPQKVRQPWDVLSWMRVSVHG